MLIYKVIYCTLTLRISLTFSIKKCQRLCRKGKSFTLSDKQQGGCQADNKILTEISLIQVFVRGFIRTLLVSMIFNFCQRRMWLFRNIQSSLLVQDLSGTSVQVITKANRKISAHHFQRFNIYNRLTWSAAICTTLFFNSSENESKFLPKSSNDQPLPYLTFLVPVIFLTLNVGGLTRYIQIDSFIRHILLHIDFNFAYRYRSLINIYTRVCIYI